jgi:predicted RNA-binding Zn ribbon-like protein
MAGCRSGESAAWSPAAAGQNCGWLFVDGGKSASRRWCSMEVCRSRAKMRRLYCRRDATPR